MLSKVRLTAAEKAALSWWLGSAARYDEKSAYSIMTHPHGFAADTIRIKASKGDFK